jgi:exopolyphosphatase / guanosine-5'-triphosphate,3'-diphosphate pyrophosphatase
MRLGVLDVGSNTVHLLVVDAHRGAHPTPAASVKNELRLAELLEPDGSISPRGADRLVNVIAFARSSADRHGVEDLVSFATSAVRDAPNSAKVLARIAEEAGVDLDVLTGEDEARLTFLAVRRWFGWSAGRLLVLDIGGGSLEIAGGVDEEPDVASSLPLGAGRLFREWVAGNDPAKRSEVAALREHIRAVLAEVPPGLADVDRAVATSKTFRSLARIAGAAPYNLGPRVERKLARTDLVEMLPRLIRSTVFERSRLPGLSPGRAAQLLAGALVADAAMESLGLSVLTLCPWALREGVILRRLDWLAGV